MDEQTIRSQALFYANDTHPNKFNIETKPSLEDLLERAEKIAKFIAEGVRE